VCVCVCVCACVCVCEQAREISKIDKLKQSQEHAMLAAARVEAAEGSIGAHMP
jgi:hypothetical protein